ncbi:VRR-NUC domain containing protein [uncultured Caudovirales phage]|uniref:VRR-NUC domain containing protein n=1 Tax=uncultured Caudovirales phage TaxID=2100421 RepID=A0A6J5M312_9CAUD|nr:VRR-NUC domain containing protein [uncultured Caudovirales phage]
MTESQLQSKIIQKFEKAGWMAVKLISTNTNGIPDLMCLKAGKTVFIEVKRKGGLVSELQKYRHDQLNKQGFQVFIIDDLSQIII